MANNDYITTDCKLTVSKNTAKLDEEIFLYKNDRNIKLLIEIVDNKYRYKSDDLSNLLVKYKASYAQVKWYKNAEVKKEFPIQATDDGKVVFVIEGQLIDEDTELGDYDLQLRLLNESQESIRSLPIIKGAVHILKPLFEEGDIATVNSAVADVSMLSLDGDAIDTYNSDGTYNQTNWGNGDVISSAKLNKLEKVAKDNVDKVNKMPAKSIVEGGKIYLTKEDGTKLDSGTELPAGGTGTSYDDTEIKSDINTIKTDLGTEELTTTAKDVKGAVNEVAAQYKDIANKIENGNIGNNIEPQLMDMPRIYFSEGTLPTSKTATVMKFDYYSKTNEYHGYVDIKCQGTSSMSYPKKNFTIKLYTDKAKTKKLKVDFKGWGKQSKFVLKANWIDITHARNVVSARIWGDIVKSRSDYATAIPELLRTSPNQGAVDGFPVTVYGNGYYQGRYTLNIPKDKWMSNMDDTLDTQCILCGENYQSGCFRALPNINGSDWTDELHDVVPATIKTSWTNVIKFVMNSSDAEFKANLSNYFDVNSLIDYLLYGIVSTGLDAFGKNQIYFTYDGIKWIASMYDMDSTWGLWWNGSKFVGTDYAREDFQDLKDEGNGVAKQGNLLYLRLQQLFIPQLKTRYAELRQTIFTYPYLVNKFEEFTQICPQDIVVEDYASTTANGGYTGIPSKTTNNIQQLRSYISARLTYVDGYINAMREVVPCTNITLNNATLSFTTSDAQTLTATVTPANTTDTVTWSVAPTGICMVDNGLVTPIKDGSCVITATCGTKSATCNVTINLLNIAVTGLNLNNNSISIPLYSNINDYGNINYVEGFNWLDGAINDTGVINGTDKYVTLENLPTGKYRFSSNNVNYTYKKVYMKYNDAYIVQNTPGNNNTDVDFYIPNKNCKVYLSLFPNNLEFDANNITVKNITGLEEEYKNIDATSIFSKSSINTDNYIIASITLTNLSSLQGKNLNFLSSILANISIGDRIYDIIRFKQTNIGQNDVNILIENANKWLLSSYTSNVYATIAIPSSEYPTFDDLQNYITNNNLKIFVNNTNGDSFKTNGTTNLVATLEPLDATNKNVTWTTNNENIELVADGLNCTVKAKAVGSSIATCTSQDTTNGTITDTCNVTVTNG